MRLYLPLESQIVLLISTQGKSAMLSLKILEMNKMRLSKLSGAALAPLVHSTRFYSSLLYRESDSLRENSDAALKLINHDVKGLSK